MTEGLPFDPFRAESLRVQLRGVVTRTLNQFAGFEIQAALLDAKGELIEVDGTNPLHFTAFEACVKATKQYLSVHQGETVITNDPYSGNTRFCDLMLFQGVFARTQANDLRFYVALQLSLPELISKNMDKIFTSVEDEGYRIPPTPLDEKTAVNPAIIQYLSSSGVDANFLNVTLEKTKKVLKNAAQELLQIEQKWQKDQFQQTLDDLRRYSEKLMRKAVHEIPDGEYVASDIIDGDGIEATPLKISCKLTVQGESILLSFAGSHKQSKGPFNCNYAMTLATCFWALRSFLETDIPINAGAFKAFAVEAPEGTIVNAKYPAPVLGGYFETTKRLVDVLFLLLNKALPSAMPAQNSGSNNVCLFQFGKKFFVQTLAGGSAGAKGFAGTDAVMTDLHNFKGRSIEEIEKTLPLQVTHSSIRESSGGDGKLNGGNGLSQGYKILSDAKVMLLSDRRLSKARGLFGGASGLNAEIVIVKDGEQKKLYGEKTTIELAPSDTFIISTPGGGAWGKTEEPPTSAD